MYMLATKVNEYNKPVFITEKSGSKRNNYYFSVDMENHTTKKVSFEWIKENCDFICNAGVCGTKVYYRKNKNTSLGADKN